MKTNYIILLIACIGLADLACAQSNSSYKKQIDDWHINREQGLKADDGWLNLVGLYWLEEGKNSFGSGTQNSVVFPAGSINQSAGYFERIGNTVKLVVSGNTVIKVDDKPVTEAILFEEGQAEMHVAASGSLRWTIIKREDKIGIRLRDLNSPAPAAFKGVERFKVDSAWRIPAVLQVPAQLSTIAIKNVIGQTTDQQSPGKLIFTIKNKQYTLDALDDGDNLMIVFGDATSGKTTYPSGRFVDVKKPGPDGKVVIDFNEAYNPPCAFTDFATCPLPPRQNILPVAVTAGEKNYGHHH